MMFGLYVLLTVAALVIAGIAARDGGRKLWLALLVLGWTVSQFNTLLEAVVFSVMPLTDAIVQLGISAIAFALLTTVALLLSGRWRGGEASDAGPHFSPRNLALIVLGYEFLYWTAGTLVWPFVEDYYSDKPLPTVALVAALQVPRALIFVLAAWPWLRTGPRHAPLVLGIVYAVVGGIAPMFPENPYMPADVRLAHGIETSVSNFLFGVLVGYLIRPRSVAGSNRKAEQDPLIDELPPTLERSS